MSFARVVMVLGDTSLVPNQGATIASETIQITAVPLRKAAAQARQFLVARAAERLELPVEDIVVEDGLVRGKDNRSVSYGELIAGETIQLELADDVPVKSAGAYTIVGQSVPRVDLPAKATGELVYVHDMRVPGMLHGRVVRPPYAGVDVGDFIGNSLIAVDETSVSDIPGLVAVVQDRRLRRRRRRARGKCDQGGGAAQGDLEAGADAARSEGHRDRAARQSVDAANADRQGQCRCGDCRRRQADAAHLRLAVSDARLDRPVLRGRRLSGRIVTRVWSGTQNPHHLRADLARLIHRREAEIEVIRMEAAGCYGRNCADDVSADAVLLSRAVGRPGARAADARAGARLGAQGHRAVDGRQRRIERRRQRRRL